MKELEEHLKQFDTGNWDITQQHEINQYFQKISTLLFEAGLTEQARLSNLNREVFAFVKSFRMVDKTYNEIKKEEIEGLKPQMIGQQTLENGDVVPLVWPDIDKYSEADLKYIQKRHDETTNVYLKTEYGLVLYFTRFNQHNDFRFQLATNLFSLSKQYLQEFESGKENYFSPFFRACEAAFIISEENKKEDRFNVLLLSVHAFLFEYYCSFDSNNRRIINFTMSYFNLISKWFRWFNGKIDYQKLYNKVIDSTSKLKGQDLHGAISAYNMSNRLSIQGFKSEINWFELSAKAYEQLGEDATRNNPTVAVSFIEKSLTLFLKAKKKEEVERLQTKYNELRGNFNLGEIKSEFDEGYVDEVRKMISEATDSLTPKEIILSLANFHMLKNLDEIRKDSDAIKAEAVLSARLPSSILDKFGNTVERFYSDEEIEEHNLLQAYNFSFQIAIQKATGFIFESLRKGKLSTETVFEFLNSTWLNEPVSRMYNGHPETIIPLNVIEPGLKYLFSELNKIEAGEASADAFILITDSLTLKVEYILRYLCDRLNIPTFKPVSKRNSADVVMEKNLDDILSELTPEIGFPEEDKFLIKYILTEKSGWNLRNRIAHGLMDYSEYNYVDAIGILLILLRFGTYQFNQNQNNDNN
jgi:hypothetical protein